MLSITDVFDLFGRAGRNAYIINGAQDLQDTPFDELVAFSFVNPSWIASLIQSYDQLIRISSNGMFGWQPVIQTAFINLVQAQDSAVTSISDAMAHLYTAMVDQADTVKQYTITSTVVIVGTNVGTGAPVTSLTRSDGLLFQNVVPEISQLTIIRDSYTGGATVGREYWTWSGAQNISSLGTGTSVGVWDWDWPQGSASSVSGYAVSADQDASTSGNLLTNGSCESWTGSPAALNNWSLAVGTWGTSIKQSASALAGTYCVQFVAGATLNALLQQFNSSTGTTANVSAKKAVLVNVFLKSTGVISGGVLTVDLYDGSSTINNDQGTAQSKTLTLSTVTTNWGMHSFDFQLPTVLPATVKLRFRISTALAGADLLMDAVSMAMEGGSLKQTYTGGPYIAVFSNPAAPFVAGDNWNVTFTNNFGGASFAGSCQSLVYRLFGQGDIILPYSGSPTIPDTVITNA